MELKLNIYEGNKVTKTYTADTLDCSFGVVEDILDVLNADSLDLNDTKALAVLVIKSMKQIKPFLTDMFGCTADELRTAKVSEIIAVLKGVFAFATKELGVVAEKN